MGKLMAVGGLDAISTITKLLELRQYLDVLKKQIDVMAEDYYRKMEEEVKAIDNPEEKNEYYENSMEEYWRYTERFPRIFMNGFLIIAYSLLETQTHSVAKRMQRKFGEVFDVDEIRGGGDLEAAILYIKKLTRVDAKQFSSWDDIKDAQRLRNIIVHSNGQIASDSTKDIELAEKCGVLDKTMIDVMGRSIFMVLNTYDYNLTLLDAQDAFFADLYGQTKLASQP